MGSVTDFLIKSLIFKSFDHKKIFAKSSIQTQQTVIFLDIINIRHSEKTKKNIERLSSMSASSLKNSSLKKFINEKMHYQKNSSLKMHLTLCL